MGLTAFNKASGHNLYYQKSIRKTEKLIPANESESRDKVRRINDDVNKNANNYIDRKLSSVDSKYNIMTSEANTKYQQKRNILNFMKTANLIPVLYLVTTRLLQAPMLLLARRHRISAGQESAVR